MRRVKIRTFTAIDGETYVEYFDKKLGGFVIKRKRVTWLKIFGWSMGFFLFGGSAFLVAGFKTFGVILYWCFVLQLIALFVMIGGDLILKWIKARRKKRHDAHGGYS